MGGLGLASLEMMRVGLLDRFLCYWGFGACGALVLLPIGDALFIGAGLVTDLPIEPFRTDPDHVWVRLPLDHPVRVAPR